MATVSRVARIRFDGAAGAFREWVATAAVQDTPAGQSVVVTVTQTSGGATPPGEADTFRLLFIAGSTVANLSLSATAASQTRTFFLTTDGTAPGVPRSGPVEILMQVDKTTGGPAATYDVDSDGSPNTPPTGFTSTLDRGFIRGTTTATTTLNRALFAYPDVITATTTLGAAPYVSRQVSVQIGSQPAVLSAASTGTVFTTTVATGTDTRFPAGASAQATVTTFPNDAFAGIPWTAATVTEATATVDPRLTRTPLFQLDDNTLGTPPMSKDVPSHQRLTTQQGFLGSRTTNARGEGINGVTYNVALTPRKPGTAVTQTGLVTATRGGEAGWSPDLTPWSSSLPGGTWDKTVTITAPTGYTGSYVVQNGSTEYALVARDPNLEARVNVNHEAAFAGRHFEAGMKITVVAYMVNVADQKRVSPFTTVRCALVRAKPTDADGLSNTFQFYDGDTWEDWTAGTAQTLFALTASPTDPMTYERQFTTDDTWGARDFRASVQFVYEGVTYSTSLVVPNVLGENRHDGYKFDGAGFLGFPSK